MSSLTAAVITGYQVRITYTKTAQTSGETLTLYRIEEGRAKPVIGALQVPNAGGVWDDPEAPLEREVFYRLVVDDVSIESPPIRVEAPKSATFGGRGTPLLTDPYQGISVPVLLISMGDIDHAARATALDIEGRSTRVVITDVEGAARMQPRLLTETVEQAKRLDEVMASGTPVLLRTPCPVLPDVWLTPTGVRKVRPFSSEGRPARRHELGTCETSPSAPDPAMRAAGDTLGDLHATVPGTLADIADRWPDTLADIAAADLKVGRP